MGGVLWFSLAGLESHRLLALVISPTVDIGLESMILRQYYVP
jgi:hypothetical protein